MLNYNTIISSFDDKGTLLKWLKTIEKALENASLSSVEKIVVDATHFKFKFIFADGSFLLSPSIEVVKGPQGPQGPQGPKGDPIDVYGLTDLLEGSEKVIVDVNETDEKVQVRLDQSVLNILARALLTPVDIPTEDKLVAIGTNGSQKLLPIPSGTLYLHKIIKSGDTSDIKLFIISSNSTQINVNNFNDLSKYFISMYCIDISNNRREIMNIRTEIFEEEKCLNVVYMQGVENNFVKYASLWGIPQRIVQDEVSIL